MQRHQFGDVTTFALVLCRVIHGTGETHNPVGVLDVIAAKQCLQSRVAGLQFIRWAVGELEIEMCPKVRRASGDDVSRRLRFFFCSRAVIRASSPCLSNSAHEWEAVRMFAPLALPLLSLALAKRRSDVNIETKSVLLLRKVDRLLPIEDGELYGRVDRASGRRVAIRNLDPAVRAAAPNVGENRSKRCWLMSILFGHNGGSVPCAFITAPPPFERLAVTSGTGVDRP